MNLREAFDQIAWDGHLTIDDFYFAGGAETQVESLARYADEDRVGGRDTGEWAGMSTFADEGKVLYALIRALRPEVVVEIGVDSGGTSTHILSALAKNGTGHLYSYDIETEVGSKVPESLRSRWTLVAGQDALIAELPERADFCFEDGPHTYFWTRDMAARLATLHPKLILTHDYYTHRVYEGFFVEQAYTEVFPTMKGVLLDGAFTGLGYVWLNGNHEDH